MEFKVPQIKHEARVVGPFTLRQSLYLGIPTAISFLLYFTVPFMIFLSGMLVLESAGLALAFMKIGGKSLPETILHIMHFSVSPKTYVWKKTKGMRHVQEAQEYTAPANTTKIGLGKSQENRVDTLAQKVQTK